MRRIIAVLLLPVVITAPADASEKDAKALVEKAVKAHGGKEKLTRARTCTRKDTGKIGLQAFVSQVSRSLPDKLRLNITSGRVKTVVVVNGDKGWISDGGPAAEMLKPRLDEIKDELYVWNVATLVPLLDKPFTLSTVPDKKAGGETLAGVKVVRKGHADTRVYF